MGIKKFILAENIEELIFLEYVDEWIKNCETMIPWSCDIENNTFTEWKNKIIQFKEKETCPNGFVTADTYFFIEEDKKIIGAVNLKYELNEYLHKYGGNIGYGIRKSERGNGYAKILLDFGIKKMFERGYNEIQISCKESNTPSKRTIISCGGKLVRKEKINNDNKEIYCIKIHPTTAST